MFVVRGERTLLIDFNQLEYEVDVYAERLHVCFRLYAYTVSHPVKVNHD